MPSIMHPTYYSRSSGDNAHDERDMFWRYISEDFAVSSTGEVDASTGHVMLIEVTHRLIADMTEEHLSSDLFWDGVPQPGWYIVRTDDNGLVWAMTYGYGTLAEDSARADFAEAEEVYAAWGASEYERHHNV